MPRFNRTPARTKLARRLRRDGTTVERCLWQRLRNGQLGDASFRRQHPAGRYILDFYCPALALAVELDGGQHAELRTRDHVRDEWLKQNGVTVLRFWNSDLTENLDGCAGSHRGEDQRIEFGTGATPPALDPHPNPPPFRGRERTTRVAPHAGMT